MIRSDEGVFEGRDGAVLRWETWAPAQPTGRVVMVHGHGEHSGRYEMLAGVLAGRGLAVLVYDQRGHGRSAGARGHVNRFDDLVADLGDAVREARVRLPGDLPEGILGHSLGGLVVLRYLQRLPGRRPDRGGAGESPGSTLESAGRLSGVVISAPWLRTKQPLAQWQLVAARALDRIWPSAPITRPRDATALTRDPVMQEAYNRDRVAHVTISPRMFFEVERAQSAVLGETGGFSSPLLFLIPGDDSLVDSTTTRDLAMRLEGDVTVTDLPGLRHEPFNEVEREEVMREVADWLIRTLRTGPDQTGSSSPE